MAELPGKDLARELIDKSEAESRATPVEAVIAVVRDGGFDDDKTHRLTRLPNVSRRSRSLLGPLQSLVVDG